MAVLTELNRGLELSEPTFRSPQDARKEHPLIQDVEEFFADQLTNNVRYNGFRRDESLEEWVSILGPDVLFLTHPQESARVTHDFVTTHDAYGIPLGNSLRNKLYIAPWIHDFGELILEGEGVGDVQFDKKTEDDEREETKIFNKVLDLLSTPEESDVLKRTYQEIVMDSNSPLGKQFKLIERVGYVETAIRAYLGHRGTRIENWQALSGNVFGNQIHHLVEQRRIFPFIDIFLTENSRIIDEIFRDVGKRPVPFDIKGNPFYLPSNFEMARRAWESSDLN